MHVSISGHMLLNLSHGKQDFIKEIVESFANKSGLSALFEALFGSGYCRENSFLGTDDIQNVSVQTPECTELTRYDIGKKFGFKILVFICHCILYDWCIEFQQHETSKIKHRNKQLCSNFVTEILY